MRKLLFLIPAIVSLIILACCSDGTGGNEKKRTPPDFTWDADTLIYPNVFQIIMDRFWGISPNDLWLAGWSSSARTSAWHFDGNTWDAADYVYSSLGAVITESVFGFAGGDVWLGGIQTFGSYPDTAVVIRLHNGNWEHVPIHGRSANVNKVTDIWGYAPDDVYFGARRSELYHWDGTQISKVELSLNYQYFSDNLLGETWVEGNQNTGEVFVSLTNYESILFAGAQLWSKTLDGEWRARTAIEKGVFNYIWMSPNGTLWVEFNPMKYYDGNSSFIDAGPVPSRGINGPSDDDLLMTSGINGNVYYWNGSEATEIEALRFPEMYYRRVWYNGEEAFVVGWLDGLTTVVFHGK